ncbi:unnamed protein product, partial [Mesorhabditis spiculigera]
MNMGPDGDEGWDEEGRMEEMVFNLMQELGIDFDTANAYLMTSDWDYERALASQGDQAAAMDEGIRNRRPAAAPVPANNDAAVPGRAVQPRQVGILELLSRVMVLPFYAFYSILCITRDLFFMLKARVFGPTLPPTEPIEDVNDFIARHEEALGPGGDPYNFIAAPFVEVMRRAKSEHRVLAVFFSSNTDETRRFLGTHLYAPGLKPLLEQMRPLFWGCSIERPEGRNVSSRMQVESAPYLGLFIVTDSVQRFASVTASVTPDAAFERLFNGYNLVRPQLDALVAQRARQSESVMLREMQDREYEESKARDREVAEKKRKEEAERKQREDDQLAHESRKEQRYAKLRDYKENLRQESKEGSGDTRIQVTFPNGTRQKYLLDKHTSAERFFDLVFQSEPCPLYFSLFQAVPRQEIGIAPTWYREICEENLEAGGCTIEAIYQPHVTIHDLNIRNGDNLMVRDLEA